jgi:hypothetical protein
VPGRWLPRWALITRRAKATAAAVGAKPPAYRFETHVVVEIEMHTVERRDPGGARGEDAELEALQE